MIIIDGHESALRIDNFSNLEEILVKAMYEPTLQDRVVTDVMVNNEHFSELYPHQAEDINASDVAQLEIRSVSVGEMSLDITQELHTVSKIMASGSRQTARLFRQANDDEALELHQDLLDVAREFLSMIGVLRNEFLVSSDQNFSDGVKTFSSLFSEMTEVLENEDWILLADLLEYEFIPACESWEQIIKNLRETIKNSIAKN
jgi:hypothetical protein